MDQLHLQTSYRQEWGVIYVDTSIPSPTIRFEITDRHLCSMGTDRNYSSISLGVLHHAYHVTSSEVNALHLYSMGSDRRYSGISIRVLYHVTHIIFSFVDTYPILQNGKWQKRHEYFHLNTLKQLKLVRILDLALVRYHSRHFNTEKCIPYGEYTHLHSPSSINIQSSSISIEQWLPWSILMKRVLTTFNWRNRK